MCCAFLCCFMSHCACQTDLQGLSVTSTNRLHRVPTDDARSNLSSIVHRACGAQCSTTDHMHMVYTFSQQQQVLLRVGQTSHEPVIVISHHESNFLDIFWMNKLLQAIVPVTVVPTAKASQSQVLIHAEAANRHMLRQQTSHM